MRREDTEVVVVGGGIAGASAAFHLAVSGQRVILLERGEIASGASGVNAGQIDSVGWGHAPDLQAWLTAGSLELFQEMQLDHGLDIEFRQSGSLTPAILCAGDDDYFVFHAVAGQPITVQLFFTHAAGNLDMTLLTPQGLDVGSSVSLTDNEAFAVIADLTGQPMERLRIE